MLALSIALVEARQTRSIADRVYSDAQAARGQQLYQAQCVSCHGGALEGVVGPPLAGDGFLAVWSARTLADLVNKIEQTMPPQQMAGFMQHNVVSLSAGRHGIHHHIVRGVGADAESARCPGR